MKFGIWLAENSGRREIMYHGTGMDAWPAIRQKGLHPYPEKRSWDEDPDTSTHTPSRASYGGIYLTQNLFTATGAAFRTANKDRKKKSNDGRLLIVVEVDPRSLIADEDTVMYAVNRVPIPNLLTTDYSVSDLYISTLIVDNPNLSTWFGPEMTAQLKDYVEKARDLYVKEAKKAIVSKMGDYGQHPVFDRTITAMLHDHGFPVAVARLAAHAENSSREYALQSYPKMKVHWPSKQQAEHDYREFVDRLTRVARKIADPVTSTHFMHAARFLKPIGFSGNNRIIYAAEIIEIEVEDRKREALRPLFGTPPEELISEWEKREGPWTWVKSDGTPIAKK